MIRSALSPRLVPLVALLAACGGEPLEAPVTASSAALSKCPQQSATNLLDNPTFATIGPSGPATTITIAGAAGPSAAAGWTLFNNTYATIKTELLPSTRRPGGTMIHVSTSAGGGDGLVQILPCAASGTCPAHSYSSAWVQVNSGRVAIGTGYYGRTHLDGTSGTTGAWEQVSAASGDTPTTEFIIYNANSGPSDFYVDSASVNEALFWVSGAALAASPPSYSGACPGTIGFKGTISANGCGAVQYVFTRSDGAQSAVQTLSFPASGSLGVGTSWTLGDPLLLPSYSGWEAIQILSPNPLRSANAAFSLSCK